MVAAYPIAKLAALLIRQISKPLANSMKERAKQSYAFRTYVCMPPAQFYHWCEVKSRMWMMGMGQSGKVPKLNEAMAIDLGANMLGEGVIFAVAAVIIVLEYNRSSKKEEERERQRVERMQQLESRIQEMELAGEQRDTQLRHYYRRLLAVQQSPLLSVLSPPPVEELPPPPPPISAVPPQSPTTDVSPPSPTTDVPPPSPTTDVSPPSPTNDVPPPSPITEVNPIAVDAETQPVPLSGGIGEKLDQATSSRVFSESLVGRAIDDARSRATGS